MLLEVVISLGILLVAMAVVGLAFHNGQQHVELAEQMTRARLMTEKLVAEMDTGLLDLTDREQSGWFGDESIPGMSWRMEVNPADRVKGLLDVDLNIYMGDPDGSEDEHQLILATRVERAEPRGIDFEKDFGLDQDQIQQLTDAIPGGSQVLDPTNFDPRSLAQLDLDTLVDLLPTLIQAFGANLAQGQIDQLIQAAQSGDLSGLQNLAGQQGGGLGGPPGGNNRGAGGGGQGGGSNRGPGAGSSLGGGPPSGGGQSGGRPRGGRRGGGR